MIPIKVISAWEGRYCSGGGEPRGAHGRQREKPFPPCKGHEAGMSLMGIRKSKEASVKGEGNSEDREVSGGRRVRGNGHGHVGT